MLTNVLVAGRTWILRVLSPAEALWRRLFRRPRLPPLWLRRHVGAIGEFERAAERTGAIIDRWIPLAPAARVIDVGCGCGAMVPFFRSRLGPEGCYVGLDVHRPSIEWCRSAWSADPRFRFELAEVDSPYAVDESGYSASSYRFPAADGWAHLVLAKSLFTHLMEPECRRYLREIARVLAPEGSALISVFVFDGNPPLFPNADTDGNFRWRFRSRPTAAVAVDRLYFEKMMSDAGLEISRTIFAFWPGHGPALSGQDLYFVRRTPPAA